MEQKTPGLYASAPLENFALEQRLQIKSNDVNGCSILFIVNGEKITYFEDTNIKPKKEQKNYKTLKSILESSDKILVIGATTASISLSVTNVGLLVVPIAAGFACALSLGNKTLNKIFLKKYNKYGKTTQKRPTQSNLSI